MFAVIGGRSRGVPCDVTLLFVNLTDFFLIGVVPDFLSEAGNDQLQLQLFQLKFSWMPDFLGAVTVAFYQVLQGFIGLGLLYLYQSCSLMQTCSFPASSEHIKSTQAMPCVLKDVLLQSGFWLFLYIAKICTTVMFPTQTFQE